MPCNSDYMEPSSGERHLSEVHCFLDELRTGNLNRDHLRGWHPLAYGRYSKQTLDTATSRLCSLLKRKGQMDLAQHSLELQLWWRDHQAADKAREKQEREQKAQAEIKKQALKKLTPTERKALGV